MIAPCTFQLQRRPQCLIVPSTTDDHELAFSMQFSQAPLPASMALWNSSSPLKIAPQESTSESTCDSILSDWLYRVLEITSTIYLRTAGSNDHPMDITAIGSLGSSIEEVTLRHCQLIKIQASILDLAKRPSLRHVDFTGCIPSACAASSWMHLTSFLIAVNDRPSNGLRPVVSLPEFNKTLFN